MLFPDHVVVDIEIQKPIESLSGRWNDTHRMGISCAVVYEYRSDRYRVYGDSKRSLDGLQKRLLRADIVSGFNIFNFDFPVIWGFERNEWINGLGAIGDLKQKLLLKTNDTLRRIWEALKLDPDQFVPRTHGGWSLENCIKGSIDSALAKSGNGALAPQWYQSGEWDRVVDYCINDVKLEKMLTDYAAKEGTVTRFSDRKIARLLPLGLGVNSQRKTLPV